MFIDAATTSLTVGARHTNSATEFVEGLKRYPTANVGDAMDRLNLMDTGIASQWADARCVGPALTVLTREGDNLAIHRALDDAEAGDVLVINALGGTTRAVFGDLLAEICLAKGIAGVIIDGLTRDRAAIKELGLPVWARGVSPAGPAKYGPGAVSVPVACGGTVVNPGDLITADDDGVAVIPIERAQSVLNRLADIDKFEEDLRVRIRNSAAHEAAPAMASTN
ncbi:RraA family protein [Pseudarthrobacter sp. MM222]|uniref:RraA family protein n=1 Tax=Pseudarthrobacter sp. MM222 TaxID=3018929 RepID=UPI0022202B89|nr:RraA family protein [Pseudarthrobacter sp. MM222]CAI3794193.1 4-carboxy-4-hydroxy-2-oxoadipate aldolase [Pseudarthrobacter sp. MM222]